MPPELVRSLQVRVATANPDERTVDAVLATEMPTYVLDRVNRRMLREILVIRQDMELPGQVPMLDSHQRGSVRNQLGSTRALRVEMDNGNRVVVGTRHFASTRDAQDAWTKVTEGHLTDGSIGYQYRARGWRDLQPGQSFQVDGRTFTNDHPREVLRITYDWEIFEDSITPIGADERAKFRSYEQGESTMTKEQLLAMFPQYRELVLSVWADGEDAQRVFDAVQQRMREDAQQAADEAARSALDGDNGSGGGEGQRNRIGPPATSDDPLDAQQVIANERARVAAIEDLAGDDVNPQLLRQAIREGWPQERASTEFLADVRRGRGEATRIGGMHDRGENMRTAIADALVHRATGRLPDDQTRARNCRDFEGIGLRETARQLIVHSGQQLPVSDEALYRAAISIADFSNLLGDAARRSLMAGYDEGESTLSMWADESEVNDFREHEVLALSAFSSLELVGNDGKLAHGTMSDKRETRQVATYGKRFGMTRKDFINDDLGFVTRIPMSMGMAARRNIDDIGYALLATGTANNGPTMKEDSKQLFSKTHGQANLLDGADSVLGDIGMTDLKRLLRLIRGLGAVTPMNLSPRYIIVPAALADAAAVLLNSREIALAMAGSTDASTVRGTANPHAGVAQLIVEGRLDAVSTTAWYLAANQRLLPSIQIQYLRGHRVPVVESLPASDDLVIGWRVYHDVGVAAVDWRSIAKSKGAA